jgi:hypothetical protein
MILLKSDSLLKVEDSHLGVKDSSIKSPNTNPSHLELLTYLPQRFYVKLNIHLILKLITHLTLGATLDAT